MHNKWMLMIYDSKVGDLPVVMDFDSQREISKWLSNNVRVAQIKWNNKNNVCSVYLPEKDGK